MVVKISDAAHSTGFYPDRPNDSFRNQSIWVHNINMQHFVGKKKG